MSKGQVATLIVLGVICALMLTAWWFVANRPDETWALLSRFWEMEEAKREELVASGVIQATEVSLSTQVSGRVAGLYVREGDEVAAGTLLLELDSALLEAQIAQAEAGIRVASAAADLLEAGVAPEEIRKVKAELQLRIAERDAALRAWEDAVAQRQNPQELDAQIAVLRAQLRALDHHLSQMALTKDAMTASKELAERAVAAFNAQFPQPLPPGDVAKAVQAKRQELWFQVGVATTNWWEAWVNLNSVTAAREGAQRKLARLQAERERPLNLEAQVASAKAALDAAEAAIRVAERQSEALASGPSKEQVALARARVAQAEAALDALRVQREQMKLVAPRAGLVVAQLIHEGEVAVAGAPLLTLADLDTVTVTVYVPVTEVGQLKVGQQVVVTTDSYPGRSFVGQVAWIADRAEFTPKNVQTAEERVHTVFAVRVEIPNPDHALKPGMPADVRLSWPG